MLQWPYKDPNEILDYAIDWSARLGVDTVASSTWTVPTGLNQQSASFTDTMTVIWLTAGADGAHYEILNRITTAGGRTMDQTVRLRIKEK